MAKLRIEYVRLVRQGQALQSLGVAETLDVSGTSALSQAAPSASADPRDGTQYPVLARLTALGGAVVVATGANPTAVAATDLRLAPGEAPVLVEMTPGHKVAAIRAADTTAVAGTFGATGQSASFAPIAGRPFTLSLWGTFSATVALQRSIDGGTTWITASRDSAGAAASYTAAGVIAVEEPEADALYRLNCTAYASGTVNYRLGQQC